MTIFPFLRATTFPVLTGSYFSRDPIEPGERKGWQRQCCEVLEPSVKEGYLNACNPPAQARMRSCGGSNASKWMVTMPTEAALKLSCPLFRYAFTRRLGMPVAATMDTCEACGRILDVYGKHRATCMRTGRVQIRHKPLVATWKRIFNKAGASIPDGKIERLMHTRAIRRNESDGRRMDLITIGLPEVFGGIPLFMDATMVHPLSGNGVVRRLADTSDGACLDAANRRNRMVDYPDVETSPLAKLLCLGSETFG